MRYLPFLPLILLPLGGCTPIDATLGGAVRQNLALQVINPDPGLPDTWNGSGDHAALAMKRFRTGTVLEPQGITTTSGMRGGSGAGMSSGGGN